ncbi:hypothetical protein MATL_G00024750 [Megalops atlanticus]|uniref:Selectin P n=1 Tax=Megalops atlanticus TaxID=7932 RepID=A0A9D3QFC5_MEGAT|nr:hypothetical protein MATL_G00024750 [Megalops atlanticus]
MLFWVHCLRQEFHLRILVVMFFALSHDLTGETGVHAWTYHYNITPNRNWQSARRYCQEHYTDMVAIQNQREIAHLNEILPKNKRYYWIGIRKTKGVWTWVGTKKALAKEAENWAEGEPNNQGRNEDCVEIYIGRAVDTAKWNDQRCSSEKGTLCYQASCTEQSCSVHAECEETIGNYSCRCHPGFQGPRCEEAVTCEPLEAPEQGLLQCTHEYGSFRFKSSCTFSCAKGFSFVGTLLLQCQASGHWSADPPSCQAVKCPELSRAPARGSMSCVHPIEPHSFNSSCEFSCEEGFQLMGSSRIQCGSSGVWTDSVPACEVQRCKALSAPLHGSMTCSHPHEEFSFTSSCNMSCEEGFLLSGTASIQCTSSGVWTDTPPVCQARPCDVLSAPLHGSMTCSHPHEEFSFTSSCNMSCEEGFLLSGTASIQCTSSGVWTDTPPLCQVQRCKALSAPLHGSMTCSHPHEEFSFTSSCNMSCEEGFLLSGTASIQCTSSGVWTDTPPLCQARPCDVLSAPLHGSMTCSHPHEEFSFTSSCNMSCEEGFLLSGTASIQCTSSGVWTDTPPLCQVQRCKALSAPLHGSMTCSHPHEEFSFTSSCNMSCEEGFLLSGTASIQCTSSGVWTDTPPVCQARPCDVLSAPLHGSMTCSHPHEEFSFTSSCDMSCEEGFLLSGTASIQCTSSGVWTDTPPVCQARPCDVLSAPLHGSMTCSHPHEEFSFTSSCNMSCEEGFLLSGTASIQCTSSGVWTDTPPLCQVQRCKALSAPLHGSMTCSHPHEEFSFTSSCNMSCEEGFLLSGTASIQCTSSGVWTDTPPLCQARQCRPLVAPDRGQINCSHPHSHFSFGSRCELGCEEGFVLKGAPTLQCTESGLWSNTAPYCQVVECEPLEASLPPQLSMNCSHPLGNFSFESKCQFRCEDGFYLNGTGRLSCTSHGIWSGALPSCAVVERTVGMGMLIYAGVGSATAASVLCLAGLGFLIATYLQRKARKDPLQKLVNSVWEQQENPAFEEN